MVRRLILYETIKQGLNAWKIGAVLAVLQKLLFPLDKTVGDCESIRRHCERIMSVRTRLREVAVEAGMDCMKILTH